VIPDKTVANLSHMATEGARWRKTLHEYEQLRDAGKLSTDVVRRARFGDEVLATTAEYVRLGVCCVLMVQTPPGQIIGIASFTPMGPKEAAINLQVIDPRYLPGSPGASQLRGIGTAMTAAISRQALQRGTETLYLHPLDQAAATFWTHRGFGPCGKGGLMCIRGKPGIERLINGCAVTPDAPDKGEVILCGLPSTVRAFSIPSLGPMAT
jgi:hypothetical protein